MLSCCSVHPKRIQPQRQWRSCVAHHGEYPHEQHAAWSQSYHWWSWRWWSCGPNQLHNKAVNWVGEGISFQQVPNQSTKDRNSFCLTTEWNSGAYSPTTPTTHKCLGWWMNSCGISSETFSRVFCVIVIDRICYFLLSGENMVSESSDETKEAYEGGSDTERFNHSV